MPERDHEGVRLLFGKPFVIPRMIGDEINTDEATEIIMVEIARLLPPDYRGVYADALAGAEKVPGERFRLLRRKASAPSSSSARSWTSSALRARQALRLARPRSAHTRRW